MSDRLPGSNYHNPIWYGRWRIYRDPDFGDPRCAFSFVHDDYDGAEDSNDNRYGFGKTVEECIKLIQIGEDEDDW